MLFGLWACLSLCVPCGVTCGPLALYKTNMNGCTGTAVQHLSSESSHPEPCRIFLTRISCLTANGCQNGCTDAASSSAAQPAKPTTASVVTQLVTSSQEPVLGSPTSSVAAPTGKVTTDGSCGAGNGNTICGNWPQGSCCSMYGVRTIHQVVYETKLTRRSIAATPQVIVGMAARAVHV